MKIPSWQVWFALSCGWLFFNNETTKDLRSTCYLFLTKYFFKSKLKSPSFFLKKKTTTAFTLVSCLLIMHQFLSQTFYLISFSTYKNLVHIESLIISSTIPLSCFIFVFLFSINVFFTILLPHYWYLWQCCITIEIHFFLSFKIFNFKA